MRNRSFRAAALATQLGLGACGGGGDSSMQQLMTAHTITFTSPGDKAQGLTPAVVVATEATSQS